MFHIIDDEAMLRELTSAMLVDYGYDVLCFESGEQYLEYLKSPSFVKITAVLSDVTIPSINGYDLALKIRKVTPLQKIILITGNADAEHHQEVAQQVCYTLNKPFNPEKLIAMIDIVNHELIYRHARMLLSGIHSSLCPKKHGFPPSRE
ncbi:response regulator [Mariprofundus ferrooxydans]|nr:response regulator [Mariprofundus ferrooxydans]